MEASPDTPNAQRRLARHLGALGLQVKLLEGERCVLAALPMRGGPLPCGDGEIAIERVLLASVGLDRVKCLRPRALFQLPFVRILGCKDARAIEECIRSAWRSHMVSLGAGQSRLDELGVENRAADGGSTRVFQIEGEAPGTLATLIDRRNILVPSAGALSGIALQGPRDRCFPIDPELDSSIEFEIGLTTHMQRLASAAIERAERRDPYESFRLDDESLPQVATRSRCLLLVGPKLAEDRGLAQKLRRRGFEVLTARGERAAVALFDQRTPDLVLADCEQGRADGVELVVRLGQLTGIDNAPVVLVDERLRPARRETARSVGAAGYLVRPLEIGKLAAGIASMIDAPRRRRFSRFGRRVSVSLAGLEGPGLATSLGRRGMLVSVDRDLPLHSLQRCRLSIPEIGAPVEVEAEVLYHGSASGRESASGLRFERFAGSGEAAFIRYLKTLATAA